jgi:S1-C subfamily serine protease
VDANGPAGQAGLQPGDIVLTLDGKAMENGRQFRINVYTRGIGETLAIEVRRGDRTLTVRVPVIERENDARKLEDLIGSQQAIPSLGVFALDLTPKIAELLSKPRGQKGAVIARVTPDAPYSQQGTLEPGDVIYALNGGGIDGAEALKSALPRLKPGAAAVLLLERDGTLMYFAFRIPESR